MKFSQALRLILLSGVVSCTAAATIAPRSGELRGQTAKDLKHKFSWDNSVYDQKSGPPAYHDRSVVRDDSYLWWRMYYHRSTMMDSNIADIHASVKQSTIFMRYSPYEHLFTSAFRKERPTWPQMWEFAWKMAVEDQGETFTSLGDQANAFAVDPNIAFRGQEWNRVFQKLNDFAGHQKVLDKFRYKILPSDRDMWENLKGLGGIEGMMQLDRSTQMDGKSATAFYITVEYHPGDRDEEYQYKEPLLRFDNKADAPLQSEHDIRTVTDDRGKFSMEPKYDAPPPAYNQLDRLRGLAF